MGALDDFRRPTCIHRSANRLCGSSYRKESTWTQLSVWPPKPFSEKITEAVQRRQLKPLPYDQRGNLFGQEGEPIKQRDSLGCQLVCGSSNMGDTVSKLRNSMTINAAIITCAGALLIYERYLLANDTSALIAVWIAMSVLVTAGWIFGLGWLADRVASYILA